MMEYKKKLQSILFEYQNNTLNQLTGNDKTILTFSTFRYLDQIYLAKSISPSKIAENINVSKPAVSRIVKKLINNGYIKKNEDVPSGCSYTVSLTRKALAIYEMIAESDIMFINILDKHLNFIQIENLEKKLQDALEEFREIKNQSLRK